MCIRDSFQPAPPARIAAVRDSYHLPPRFLIHLSTIEPRKNLMRLLLSLIHI